MSIKNLEENLNSLSELIKKHNKINLEENIF